MPSYAYQSLPHFSFLEFSFYDSDMLQHSIITAMICSSPVFFIFKLARNVTMALSARELSATPHNFVDTEVNQTKTNP